VNGDALYEASTDLRRGRIYRGTFGFAIRNRCMKLAVVSTTINGEKGYLSFDRLAADSPFEKVFFIVSGDKNSKPFDTSRFQCPVEYLDASAQARFKCSTSIGWNKIMRRNIALLRAMEMEPDFILMIDDDNIPRENYFNDWYCALHSAANRTLEMREGAGNVWFNYLKWSGSRMEIYPRGFPIRFRGPSALDFKDVPGGIPNNRIGLYQGVSLGDCDIDAITRIAYPDAVESLTEKNYCVSGLWSPYNTQNTVFSRLLFPLAFVWPFCGRYDDTYSSYVWQQILFTNGLYVHVGDPVNRQERGQRDILKDLSSETEGYMNAHLVWEDIRKITAAAPLSFLEALIKSDQPIIQRQSAFMSDFLEDVRRILENASACFRLSVRGKS
jgi:hypothetical protein